MTSGHFQKLHQKLSFWRKVTPKVTFLTKSYTKSYLFTDPEKRDLQPVWKNTFLGGAYNFGDWQTTIFCKFSSSLTVTLQISSQM